MAAREQNIEAIGDPPKMHLGAQPGDILPRSARTIVRIKRKWVAGVDDDPSVAEWETRDDIFPVGSLRYGSRAGGGSMATLQRFYGKATREPGEVAFSQRDPIDLRGAWVWILGFHNAIPQAPDGVPPAPGTGVAQTLLVGRIESQTNEIGHVSTGQNGFGQQQRHGTQIFNVVGPEKVLEQTIVTGSHWRAIDTETEEPTELDWLPDMNRRGSLGRLKGNRSLEKVRWGINSISKQTYAYGGDQLWSHYTYLQYLLASQVVEITDSGLLAGPDWIAEIDLNLSQMVEPISFPDAVPVADIIDRLIPRSSGLDWFIRPLITGNNVDVRGFLITVAPFAAESSEFGGFTYHGNSRIQQFDVGGDPATNELPEYEAKIEEDDSNLYDAVEILSDRIVVCTSFAMEQPPGMTIGENAARTGWDSVIEAFYKAATSLSPGSEESNDAYRAQDLFRDVYAAFTFNHLDFDLSLGRANPIVDGETVTTLGTDNLAKMQRWMRSTLTWLPLQPGYDYSTDPPSAINNRSPANESKLLEPMAFLFNADANGGNGRWERSDDLTGNVPSGHLAALDETLGVRLDFAPNHALARGTWDAGTYPSSFDPDTESGFDYRKLVFTIAFQTDLRVKIRVERDEEEQAGRGTKRIVLNDAKFWYLGPDTVVGVTAAGALQYSPVNAPPNPSGVIIRDDRDMMLPAVSGAVARWLRSRVRTQVRIAGQEPNMYLLGSVIFPYDGGQSSFPSGLVTRVQWDFDGREGATWITTEQG